MQGNLPIVLSIIFGSVTVGSIFIGCAWKLAQVLSNMRIEGLKDMALVKDEIAGVKSELVGHREVLLAQNRRIERMESKL
jgi:hypothetical protein